MHLGFRVCALNVGFRVQGLQGYLAHKKLPPSMTLQQAYGGVAVSYERGTPVWSRVSDMGVTVQGRGRKVHALYLMLIL